MSARSGPMVTGCVAGTHMGHAWLAGPDGGVERHAGRVSLGLGLAIARRGCRVGRGWALALAPGDAPCGCYNCVHI